MERLKQRGADLVYRCGKGHTEPLQSDKYSGELVLTPVELIHTGLYKKLSLSWQTHRCKLLAS